MALQIIEPQKLQVMSPNKLKAAARQVGIVLARVSDAAEIIKVAAALDAIEDLMRAAGLFGTDEILPVNQNRMLARWKLGRALSKLERGRPGRKGNKVTSLPHFNNTIKELGIAKPTAIAAQRIGALPPDERDIVFKKARAEKRSLYFGELITAARPYWYKVSRQARHRSIAAVARLKMTLTSPGPFPLLYADPPWRFEIYSPKGLERTPDQHYPTLTDDEIINFRVSGSTIPEIAHHNAALLLWCTSSNMKRAIAIMERWDFTFKTSAVWDKGRTGLGLVFRNQHEVLLYGTRGNMPGPQYQPPSVFQFPRGRHSAKPGEIRTEIERMYPDFDETARIELFARETVPGWTTYGFEALDQAAE